MPQPHLRHRNQSVGNMKYLIQFAQSLPNVMVLGIKLNLRKDQRLKFQSFAGDVKNANKSFLIGA